MASVIFGVGRDGSGGAGETPGDPYGLLRHSSRPARCFGFGHVASAPAGRPALPDDGAVTVLGARLRRGLLVQRVALLSRILRHRRYRPPAAPWPAPHETFRTLRVLGEGGRRVRVPERFRRGSDRARACRPPPLPLPPSCSRMPGHWQGRAWRGAGATQSADAVCSPCPAGSYSNAAGVPGCKERRELCRQRV